MLTKPTPFENISLLFSYFGPLCAFLFDDGALPYMKGIIIINDSLHKFSPWIIIYNDDHNDLHIT